MSLFEGSSGFVIEGGSFTALAGDQHIYYVRDLGQPPERQERKSAVLKQYQEIPTGNVYLKRKIVETPVNRWDVKGWKELEARRTICVASVEDTEREFLHVQYSGPDAAKACKLDLDTFSAVKDINYIQLFGYSNLSALPALVFYDALVPVSRIFERNKLSPILYTYFSYQAVVSQGLDFEIPLRELWANPKTGILCKGPYVQDSSNFFYDLSEIPTNSAPGDDCLPLTLGEYGDNTVLFEYLKGRISMAHIIQGIRLSRRASAKRPNDNDAKFMLSSPMPRTIYRRASRDLVARCTGSGEQESWYYKLLERWSEIPEDLRESTVILDDGTVRFTLKLGNAGDLESFELYYVLRPSGAWNGFVQSWLSQAHGIFSQIRIGENEAEDLSLLSHVCLLFASERKDTSHTCNIPPETPLYLFIQPIPRPSDEESKWDAWLSGAKYYWSFVSSGIEMSEDERLGWGLPSFEATIQVWDAWWNSDAYDILEMVHRSKGYDPASVALAISLGYPIFEVIGAEARFEEVDNDEDNSNSDDSDMDEYLTADELPL